MEARKTGIEGVFIIEPRLFKDDRGYFFESFNQKEFDQKVGHVDFVQDNESKSSYGVVRGLHFQKGVHAQSKLVRVVKGTVLDVAVDIRPLSPTFGQHVSVVLSEENHLQFFIPRGLAHGFSVLSEEAIFQYKCDNFYCKESEGAIAWDDPDLGIDWQVPADKVILSEKDSHHPRLKDLVLDRGGASSAGSAGTEPPQAAAAAGSEEALDGAGPAPQAPSGADRTSAKALPIFLYTDGAASGNPGPGGYGVVLKCGTMGKEISGGFSLTTNNRMELLAVITGLEAIRRPNAKVEVFSDSSYVVKAVNEGWLANWERKGWKKSDKKPVENQDLWQRFLDVFRRHDVTFHWIKGHAGHPENERCDSLAVAAAAAAGLPEDEGYVLSKQARQDNTIDFGE